VFEGVFLYILCSFTLSEDIFRVVYLF